jgi:hypothetical protein
MCLKKNLANHHQNVIQLKTFQKTFIQFNVHFWKKSIFNMYGIEGTLRIKLKKFPFGKNQ